MSLLTWCRTTYLNNPKMESVSIKDIAKVAGVSVSTVSRVLNGVYEPKSEKAKLVLKVAKELNYMPNLSAISLKTKSTHTIGIVIPDVSHSFFSLALKGMQKVFAQHRYQTMLMQTSDEIDLQNKALNTLINNNVDGLLISNAKGTESLDWLEDLSPRTKILQFDRVIYNSKIPYLDAEDEMATYMAGKQLTEKGLKSFLFVSSFRHLPNNESRLAGYKKACHEAGASLVTFYQEKDNFSEVFKEVDLKKIDCIVCYNDQNAAIILNLLKEAGINIPEEISVCGFDNSFYCSWLSPSLTSVDRSIQSMGEACANKLLQLINDEGDSNESFTISPKLVERDSTR